MKVIKNQKEAKELKFGEQYVVDIFPADPEKITETLLKRRDKIVEAAEKAVKEVDNV